MPRFHGEEPEIEPEPEPEPEPEVEAVGAAPQAPVVEGPPRAFEYRAVALALDDVGDGEKLASLVNGEAEQGWDLVQVVPAAGSLLVLLRRLKKQEPRASRVGFVIPGR